MQLGKMGARGGFGSLGANSKPATTPTPGSSVILLVDGTSKLLQADGTSKVIKAGP